MWELRKDPRIVRVFEAMWGTNELLTSFDGCPSPAQWPTASCGCASLRPSLMMLCCARDCEQLRTSWRRGSDVKPSSLVCAQACREATGEVFAEPIAAGLTVLRRLARVQHQYYAALGCYASWRTAKRRRRAGHRALVAHRSAAVKERPALHPGLLDPDPGRA